MKYLTTLALLLIGSLAQAGNLPMPDGPVVLTVSGAITNTNGENVAHFDHAMLEQLAQRTTTAATPWFEDAHDFSGPLAASILEAVGANGGTLRVIALNDYSADIPIQDTQDFPVVFATHLDGELMSVRDKGPMFLIYPFDEFPELFNEVYFGRSVWQITRIEVLDE